jgi:ABC-2 type transport system ATP-binding protein
MPVIEVNGLTKAFRTYKKQPGFAARSKDFSTVNTSRRLPSTKSASRLNPANSSVFSARTARARPPRSRCSPACFIRRAASAKVLGYTPWERADGYRRQFALVLGQKNQLWWDLPARESLELNAKIYGIPADRFERTVAEMSELLAVRTSSTSACANFPSANA